MTSSIYKIEGIDPIVNLLSREEAEDQRRLQRKRQYFGIQFRLLQKQLSYALEVGPTWSDFRVLVAQAKRDLATVRKYLMRLETEASYELVQSLNIQASIRAICQQVSPKLATEIEAGLENLHRLYRDDPAIAS